MTSVFAIVVVVVFIISRIEFRPLFSLNNVYEKIDLLTSFFFLPAQSTLLFYSSSLKGHHTLSQRAMARIRFLNFITSPNIVNAFLNTK